MLDVLLAVDGEADLVIVDAPPELISRIKESIAGAVAIDEHEVAVDHELVHQIWSTGQPEFQQRILELQQQISRS